MPEKLIELFEYCSKNKIDFHYLLDDDANKNSIVYNKKNKILTVRLPDLKDDTFDNKIDEKLKELKQLFE